MAEDNTKGHGQPRQRTRKMPRRSDVYEHFTCFRDAQGNDKARCKYCDLVLGAKTKNGTSNLRTHVRVCKARDAESHPTSSSLPQPQPQPQLLLSGPGESSDREPTTGLAEETSRDLARMIALHGYDSSVVEDDYFRSFVHRLNPEFKVPSRRDIEEMCDGIFDEARRDSLSRLRRAPGRYSLAVGKAKTPEAGEVMYQACHFIDDQWTLHKMVMDAAVPPGHHCREVDGVILGFDVVSDAADYFIEFFIQFHRDRPFMVAYIMADDGIHAELKDFIKGGTHGKYPSCTTTTYVDNMLHSIARCLLPGDEFTSNMFEGIWNLNLRRQEGLQLLLELDLEYEWAYHQRWCPFYCYLEVLRKRGFDFKRADLFVKLLCKVWEQVYRGFQRISASTCPTSNLCLPELFKLREILQSELAWVEDDHHADINEYLIPDKSIIKVLTGAIDRLDKAIKGTYLVWSVPLALDPRYKLNYIEFSSKRAFGSEEAAKYVSEVTKKINKLYAEYIEDYGTITGADHSDIANAMATTSSDPLEQAWNEHCRSQDAMAAQANSCYPKTQTDLDRYLQDPLAEDPLAPAKDFDVLNWWKVHSSQYPMVARMARDALAMPTCSKLSPDQLAQVRSILRGYSKKSFGDETFSSSSSSSSEGGDMI